MGISIDALFMDAPNSATLADMITLLLISMVVAQPLNNLGFVGAGLRGYRDTRIAMVLSLGSFW